MGDAAEDRPLDSWRKIYGLVIVFAVLLFALLYWLTTTFNIPVSGR
jgi:hypothetical protein